MIRSRSTLALAFVTIGALGPSPAWAAPPADLAAARTLFKQAEADEKAEHWETALAKLRQASTIKMTPGIRFHIALCEEKLGRLVDALNDYSAAQIAAREADNREVLGLVGEPLLALKVRVPTLTVTFPATFNSADAQLDVRLDHNALPATSLGHPVPVDVGTHTLEATASGQAPFTTTFTVTERQGQSVLVPFTAVAAPAAPVLAPLVATTVDTPPLQRSHTLAIVATVGAVVLVGGGVGAFAGAGSEQSSSVSACGLPHANQQTCGSATTVRALDAVALGAWIAAGASAATAIVLWTRHGSDGTDSGKTALTAGPGSLWLSGSF